MVFRLMSDIRTKLLLGTSIGAVTMMFVMAAGIDFSNDANVTEMGVPIMGHATVMAIHPDGSAQYAQGDNEIMGEGKDIAAKEVDVTIEEEKLKDVPTEESKIGLKDKAVATVEEPEEEPPEAVEINVEEGLGLGDKEKEIEIDE